MLNIRVLSRYAIAAPIMNGKPSVGEAIEHYRDESNYKALIDRKGLMQSGFFSLASPRLNDG
jgi:hypothetical protein